MRMGRDGIVSAGAVGGQRIGYRPALRLEGALRQPGHQGWDRRRQARYLSQGGEDVVWSYGRCGMPYHHAQYRTGVSRGRLAALDGESNDRPPRIEPARAGLHHPLDLDLVLGHQGIHRISRLTCRNVGQLHLPLRCLQQIGQRTGRGLDDLNDVQARGQGRVEGGPNPLRVEALGRPRSRGTQPRWPPPWRLRPRTRSSGVG